MSWLARSIASSLRLSPSGEEQEPTTNSNNESKFESDNLNRTVQDDVSDLTQTLTRQFWGVASFLSSQNPTPGFTSSDDHPAIAGSPRFDGIKSDFAEIGDQFKSSISLISNANVVSQVSKIATSFLQFGSGDGEAVNKIDGDVVVLVRNLSMCPQTWLDFPDLGSGELELSEAQHEHIFTLERLVPELSDLKNELCPGRMTERHFWKIYFLLLLPRLDKDEAELLSSPEIMKLRELVLQGSHDKLSEQPEKPETKSSDEVVPTVQESSSEEKVILPVQTEDAIIDKTVIEEKLTADNTYSWFEEDIDETTSDGSGRKVAGQLGQVEVDVSFSDLEEDDDDVIKKKEMLPGKVGTGQVLVPVQTL